MHTYKRHLAVVLAIGLVLTGCNAAKGTPIPQVTPSLAPTLEPTETPTATPLATDTPLASATVAPTATPTEVATPTPGVPGGDPTTCTSWSVGTTAATFTSAVAKVKFDVYCGVMPSGWHLSTMSWSQPKGSAGQLTVTYANKTKTASVTLSEGDFCSGCAWVDVSDLGSASFGSMSATLKLRVAGQYALYVNPGATIQYQANSTGLSQSAFTAITAALLW
jgi:hypothetical protein